MGKEVSLVRWKYDGKDAFPQTHAYGVVGLDDYIEQYVNGTDTGWKNLSIGAMKKSSHYSTGFNTSYRIRNGVLILRINVQHVTDKNTLKLPPQLIKYPQETVVNTSKMPSQIYIKTDGTVHFNITKYNKDWSSDDYVYQELYFYVN